MGIIVKFSCNSTKQGTIKTKAISAMEHQTDMQLDQIKQQMSLLAQQANAIKNELKFLK